MSKGRSRAISECKKMLGKSFKNHHFHTRNEAQVEMEKRSKLWKQLEQSCNFIKNNNKIHYGELSPGCKSCVEGKWTCLFIGGKCPNGCFFCPDPQNEDRPPNANGIEFKNVRDFITYLKTVGSTGVSFSGGEPLLYLELVKEYCIAIRKEFSSAMYIWCYTSGLGVNETALEVLKEAGVDELRFNIAAFDYDLSKLSKALKYIPKVTVEIPAVPEDLSRLKTLIKELALIGVDYLNLHEMALTSHNEKQMALHGYKLNRLENCCTIHESEMSILRIMDFASKNNIKLPINSCNSLYKERISCNAKTMIAAKLLDLPNWDEITNVGLIRTIGISISRRDLHLIKKKNVMSNSLFDEKQGVLFASPQIILDILDSSPVIVPNLSIGYDIAIIVRSNRKKSNFIADRFEYTDLIELTVNDLRKIAEKKYDQLENTELLDFEIIPNGLNDLVI